MCVCLGCCVACVCDVCCIVTQGESGAAPSEYEPGAKGKVGVVVEHHNSTAIQTTSLEEPSEPVVLDSPTEATHAQPP